MKDIERRKSYISNIDIEIETFDKVIDIVEGAFSQDEQVKYHFKVTCEDLSEYESRSRDFFKSSADLLKRKDIESVSIDISSSSHSFNFVFSHGTDKYASYFSIESSIRDKVDSYITQLDEYFTYIKRDEQLIIAFGYFSFGLYAWLSFISLGFGAWLLWLDAWPSNISTSFWSFITLSPIIVVSSYVFFLGMYVFSLFKKYILFPYVSIISGRRGRRQREYRKYAFSAFVFLLITLIPALYSYISKPIENPNEKSAKVSSHEEARRDVNGGIIFEVTPSKVVGEAGQEVFFDYSVFNKSEELLRNVEIENRSSSGISISHEQSYIDIGFISSGKVKRGKFALKIPDDAPDGIYDFNAALEGDTLDSSFSGIYDDSDSTLNKRLLIEVLND